MVAPVRPSAARRSVMSSAGTRRSSLRARRWALLVFLISASCMVREVQTGPALDRRSQWVLLPLRNQTETPQAGERAEAILSTLLRSHGLADLADYGAP